MYVLIYRETALTAAFEIKWSRQKTLINNPESNLTVHSLSWDIFVQYSSLFTLPQVKTHEKFIDSDSLTKLQSIFYKTNDHTISHKNLQLHTWPFILFSLGLFSLSSLLIWHILFLYKKYKKKQTALNLYRTSLGKYLPGVYVEQTQV